MSIASLLTQTVNHHVRAAGSTDDYNNVTETWGDGVPLLGRLEQRSSQEITQDRQTVISDWVLYLHPTVTVGERDRFSDTLGRTFEVTGAPAMQSAPDRDVFLEVSLRYVSTT